MATDLTPAELRCDDLTNLLGIDTDRPRLSWTLRAERRGQRQTAYQILVAGSEQTLRAGAGDLWDSGRVASNQTVHIPYGGLLLRSGQQCWWSVRVWDRDGEASDFSDPTWWEMGLLDAADWAASWIALGEEPAGERPLTPPDGEVRRLRDLAELDLPPSPYLRTTFDLTRPVKRARVYATARGLYELRLNGERVGDAVLSPGWTDYRRRIQYQTYDVGHLLREGANAVGAILGTGWYCGHLGWFCQTRHYGGRPQLLVQLVVEHDDRSTTTVVSNGKWRTTIGPIRYGDLLMGERYDARLEMSGWDRPGFDDAGWEPVHVAARDTVALVADRAEPVRVIEEMTPVAVSTAANGGYLIDLGQNISGWVRVRAQGPAGTEIRLRFGEMLDRDGSLYTENLRSAHQTDTFVLRGEGEEVFEPRFTFHGFRYVEVTGYPGELTPNAITGCVVASATPPSGTFACSHPLVNRLQRNIVWGQRGNFLSIPTDCPQRDERLGWLADAQVFARTACFNADVAAFFRKWLVDVADAQSAAGAFPDVAPRMINVEDGAPAWGDAGVVLPWVLYQCYGDSRFIEDHYDGMVRWLDYLQAANPDLLWWNKRGRDFGDWLSIEADTPKEVIATAYFAYDARLLARMARAIGREKDAARFDDLFARIKAAFVESYVAEDGRVAGETQTCYLLALHMDLLPGNLRPAAVRLLIADLERRDLHLSTGFVGLPLLCPVLTDVGRVDVAYRLLLNETFPSWGYMIRNGATTVWERWDGWTEERGFQTPAMNSFNHYAFGSVGEWLYRAVAGLELDPERPGYEHVVIRPYPGGGLTHARAEYRSVRGTIVSGWRIEEDALHLDITVPANIIATVYVPASGADMVTEGRLPAGDAEGVKFMRMAGDRAVFEVGSGSYAFRSGNGL